ncbi:hypothetical protein [Qipengyuania nanhaisediminis]|uniref:hypothetical protein n=1 Tax=Qipengyuania nanhaisediminis TaxID=604088 RepID=UPI0038B373ED
MIHCPAPQTPKTAYQADWQATAMAWRGACLDLYSRTEAALDDCIAELECLGCALGRDSHHPGAKARHRALALFLGKGGFTCHDAATARKLADWAELAEERAWFAHGTMKVTGQGVVFMLSTHDGSRRLGPETRAFSRIEMVAWLRRIASAKTELASQLGQIRAEAKRRGKRAA